MDRHRAYLRRCSYDAQYSYVIPADVAHCICSFSVPNRPVGSGMMIQLGARGSLEVSGMLLDVHCIYPKDI